MIKRNLLVIALTVLLSACGFQLRGTGHTELAIKDLDISARDAYGETARKLRQILENSGVNIHSGAPYKLILLSENESQRSLSSTGTYNSAEYGLKTVLDYEIQGSQGRSLLRSKLEVRKVYMHDGNNLAGSSGEAEQIRKEMRSDLVQQLVLRLQLLTPDQLAVMQKKADDKAQADADALEAARKFEASQPQQSPLEVPNQ